jgi:hypothetical protein
VEWEARRFYRGGRTFDSAAGLNHDTVMNGRAPFSRVALACLSVGLVTCALTVLAYPVAADRIPWLSLSLVTTLGLFGLSATWVLGLWALRVLSSPSGGLRGSGAATWGIALATIVAGGGMLFLPVCQQVHAAGTRALRLNRMQQIGMAMLNYNDAKGHLPPAAIRAADGRPLLSWRVAILPFLGEDALYERFHLDEPWDSAHNLTLLASMPDIYKYALISQAPRDSTYFQVLVGPGTAFERDGLRFPQDFPDGMSNTITVVETAEAVPWTKPADLAYDPNGPIPAMGAVIPGSNYSRHATIFCVTLAEGSSRSLDRKISEATLRALISRNGNDAVVVP